MPIFKVTRGTIPSKVRKMAQTTSGNTATGGTNLLPRVALTTHKSGTNLLPRVAPEVDQVEVDQKEVDQVEVDRAQVPSGSLLNPKVRVPSIPAGCRLREEVSHEF